MDDLKRISTNDQAVSRDRDIGEQTSAFYHSVETLPDDLRNDLTCGFHEFVLISAFGIPDQIVRVAREDE